MLSGNPDALLNRVIGGRNPNSLDARFVLSGNENFHLPLRVASRNPLVHVDLFEFGCDPARRGDGLHFTSGMTGLWALCRK
jgi:hypothetical protein